MKPEIRLAQWLMASVFLVMGGYRLWQALAVAFGTAGVFYVVFEVWFMVPLLKGPIEAWLRIH